MTERPKLDFEGTDRFEVRRLIGTGTYGRVYEALDRERGSVVALKVLRYLTAEALYRFKNEFRALAEVSHPNLVSLYELIEDKGQWFFTMELVDGVDFLTYVRGVDATHVLGSEDPSTATSARPA